MDEATLELRRKIDEMLLASSNATSYPARASEEPGGDGGHGLLGAFRMEDFAPRAGVPVQDQVRDEREDIQAEVRGIIKSCL